MLAFKYLPHHLLSFFTLSHAFVIYPEAFNSPQTLVQQHSTSSPLPLVLWHGLGDNFENPDLQDLVALANEMNPGTYVRIVSLAETGSSDRSATFFGNVTTQIEQVCAQLSTDPALTSAPAINALGFSQGGQFLRGFIERCNTPKVHNLVTFGSQHNGISEFQSCSSSSDWTCRSANALLRSGTWSNFVQSTLVPAQYFRDPEELDPYLEHSNFLADINNERTLKNQTYKENLSSLNRFVMYLFEQDTTVVPKESSWFQEVNRTSLEVTPLKQRAIYKEDWIGLKALDEKGGLVFDTFEGGHMRFNEKDLRKVFKTYFGPVASEKVDAQDQGSSFDDQEEL